MRVREPFGAPFAFIGGYMVETFEIARMALRYDTAVALAFRRALGIDGASWAAHARGRGASGRRDGRYAGLPWCFENHGSPMDGR